RDRPPEQRLQTILDADVVAGLQGAPAAGSDARGLAPYRRGEVGVATPRAGRVGHRVVDERDRQQAIVAGRAHGRQGASRLLDHQDRHVVAGLVVEAERVVPRLAAQVVEVTVDGPLLRVDLRLGQPAYGHPGRPLRSGVR